MAVYPGYGGYPQFTPNYQQYQQFQPAPQHQEPQNNGLIWIQGEAGAKAYLVAPGNTVLLMDSEGSNFYLKAVDNTGMPSLRKFSYTEVTSSKMPQNQLSGNDRQFVSMEEYNEVLRRISALEGIVNKEENHE